MEEREEERKGKKRHEGAKSTRVCLFLSLSHCLLLSSRSRWGTSIEERNATHSRKHARMYVQKKNKKKESLRPRELYVRVLCVCVWYGRWFLRSFAIAFARFSQVAWTIALSSLSLSPVSGSYVIRPLKKRAGRRVDSRGRRHRKKAGAHPYRGQNPWPPTYTYIEKYTHSVIPHQRSRQSRKSQPHVDAHTWKEVTEGYRENICNRISAIHFFINPSSRAALAQPFFPLFNKSNESPRFLLFPASTFFPINPP